MISNKLPQSVSSFNGLNQNKENKVVLTTVIILTNLRSDLWQVVMFETTIVAIQQSNRI